MSNRMTVIYAGWAKPWLRYRRNDTYYACKHILTIGPWIIFAGIMTKDEMLAAYAAEEAAAALPE
jgi:hypothetical protein